MTLALVIVVPLAAGALLLVAGGRLGRAATAALGVAGPAVSFVATAAIAQAFVVGKTTLVADLGPWLPLRGSDLGLRVDPVAVPIMLATAGAATLIALHAATRLGRGARRFLIALDLLTAALLTVVMARDLVLVLVGWEIVGLCAYLLIGHARERPDAAVAGARALVMSRVSDIALLGVIVGSLALFRTVGLEEIAGRLAAITLTPAASSAALALGFLTLIAGAARMAQLPLHGWLPDPRATPAAALAAVHALVPVSGAVLLVRLGAGLHPTVLAAAVATGAITAIIASLGVVTNGPGERSARWITIAQLGAVMVAGGLGSVLGASFLMILAILTRCASFLRYEAGPGSPRPGALEGLGLVAVLIGACIVLAPLAPPAALAALLIAATLASAHVARTLAVDAARVDRRAGLNTLATLPAIVSAVVAVAFFALVTTGRASLGVPAPVVSVEMLAAPALAITVGVTVALARARIHLPSRLATAAADLASASWSGAVAAISWSIAGVLAHGAEGGIGRGAAMVTVALARAGRASGEFAAGSVWAHEALFIAATAAIVAYWVVR